MADREMICTIQLSGLKMLHEFDRICKKYNIQYFAFAGTLLGAVRHHGYIPWDDDLDLGIFREDYEKLEKVPAGEWGEELELLSPASPDPKHDKFFPRVYLKKSRIQSYKDVRDWKDPGTNKAWHTSLMIDLYIFDEIPDDDNEFRRIRTVIQENKARYKVLKLKPNLHFQFGKQYIKKVGKSIYGSIARMRYKEPWKKIYDESLREIRSGAKGSRSGSYYSNHEDMRFDKNDLFPLLEMDFEDMKIPVPHNYTDFLEVAYGKNYMEFPPEKDRYHINFIFADLGNGTVLNIDPIPGSLGEKA